jgi:hypothetical protein
MSIRFLYLGFCDLPIRIIGQRLLKIPSNFYFFFSQINKCSLFLFNWDEKTRLEYAPNGIMNATVSIHFLESFADCMFKNKGEKFYLYLTYRSSVQLPTQENQNNDLGMVNQQLQIEIDRLRAQIEEINGP